MVNTKKNIKKIFAFLLCIAVIGCVFAGCSKSGEADEITDKTMLIAYKVKFIDKSKKEIYIEVKDYIGGEIE